MKLTTSPAEKERIIGIFINKKWFDFMYNHQKTLELRLNQGLAEQINKGDFIVFKTGSNFFTKVEVLDVRIYKDLDAVLEKEDISKIAPGLTEEDFLKEVLKIYDLKKIKRHGLRIFEIRKAPTKQVKEYTCSTAKNVANIHKK